MGYSYNQNGVEHTNEDKTGTKSEAFNQVMDGIKGVQKKLETQITPIEKRLSDLERDFDQKSNGYRGASQLGMGGRESAADTIVKAIRDNGEILAKAGKVQLDVKASGIIDSASGAAVRGDGVGTIGLPTMFVGFHNALDHYSQGGVNQIVYSQYQNTYTGEASIQAVEGDKKAQLTPAYKQITQNAITVAGFSKISRQAMSDNQELNSAVNIVLRRSLSKTLDNVMVNGNGTDWTGYKTLAKAYKSPFTAMVDAISDTVQKMQIDGFVPNVVVLSPADWLTIQTQTNTLGDYLAGFYLGQLPEQLRGLRVVLSPSATAGSAYVLDSTLAPLSVVDEVQVMVGFDSDDFTRNLATILCETRVIPSLRVLEAVRLVTPTAKA